MPEIADACKAALATLSRSIDANGRFPGNVFVGEWEHFFFFDSDWMFDQNFVETMKAVLAAERGSCASIANLDEVFAGSNSEKSSFVFDASTTAATYLAALKGSQAKLGWIYGVDRFACASESGDWCMYCERRNELAVVATKPGLSDEVRHKLTDSCKALQLDRAIAQSHIYALSSKGLSSEWRTALPKHYLK